MKIAVMQPYFAPYIGYFQLINAVEKFVIYDDVNFINRGWINRNRILVNGKEFLFTINLNKASQNKKINEITIYEDGNKFLKTLEQSYKKAEYFEKVFPLVETIFRSKEVNLARFIGNSILHTCCYLNIKTELIYSSSLEKNNQLKAQDKILDICMRLKADTYINPINGVELYERKFFNKHNVNLFFLKTGSAVYKQFENPFVPWLSIIDVMMFNPVSDLKQMLNNYELI